MNDVPQVALTLLYYFLALFTLGNVCKEHCHFIVIQVTNPKRIHVVPSSHWSRTLCKANSIPGDCYIAISLEPLHFQVRNKLPCCFSHCFFKSRLFFKNR